jgi:4'-phosphopantetheinyl transferase EntD
LRMLAPSQKHHRNPDWPAGTSGSLTRADTRIVKIDEIEVLVRFLWK